MRPLLSVVIPAYNSERYIEETLLSLQANQDSSVEYLLVDGGSSDATMEIVEKYRSLFSVIISEPDKGQSDAFNKGFKLAKGRYFTWLNSDDVFCPNALSLVLKRIELRDSEWYAANVVYVDPDAKIMRCCQSGSFEQFALRFGILNVFGPSTIFSRDLFERVGGFRQDFHYGMDTEYWWRIARVGIQYKRIPVYLWALRLHDDAKTASAITKGMDSRPPRMKEEGVLLASIYYPNVSPLKRRLGTFLVRCVRLIRLHYVRSLVDTRRWKCSSVNAFDINV